MDLDRGRTEPTDLFEVPLIYHAAGIEAARAWADASPSTPIRNGVGIAATKVGMDSMISISGPSADPATNDVALDLLVADFSTSSVDAPTLIE